MYESYPCTRCSYHDFLSCSGSRGFYLDPVENYGTDHFHSRESVPCSFARSVYVWCCRFILRTYQEFLIALCFCFLLSCPAFAEDENYQFQYIGYEAMANQGIDVNQYLYDQYQEERNSEIAQILAEPLANPSLRSSSDDNIISRYHMYTNQNQQIFSLAGSGYAFAHPTSNLLYSSDGTIYSSPGWIPSPPSGYMTFTANRQNPYIMYADLINASGGYDRFNFYTDFPSDGSDVTVQYSSTFWGSDYLTNVAEVFTWILDHISEFITFILGNAFLSVSLLLFLCGAVISFYVRIRRS